MCHSVLFQPCRRSAGPFPQRLSTEPQGGGRLQGSNLIEVLYPTKNLRERFRDFLVFLQVLTLSLESTLQRKSLRKSLLLEAKSLRAESPNLLESFNIFTQYSREYFRYHITYFYSLSMQCWGVAKSKTNILHMPTRRIPRNMNVSHNLFRED